MYLLEGFRVGAESKNLISNWITTHDDIQKYQPTKNTPIYTTKNLPKK